MDDIWFWVSVFLYFTGAVYTWIDYEIGAFDGAWFDKYLAVIGWPIVQFVLGIYLGWQILKEKWYY